ncbi:hypothetical protein CAFE_15310 [Caprobacter fermentans]|uniref:Uncharacterized protein n=1 Tax=Caproicibacter fermentans TaxID=2576756 RepID=A0A6N8HZT6_9FIRM|nr:hypothetical protein [Caproicibacter fermentans]MVB10833.1 hypothetical protein [Caproicibacter fermentans]
MLELDQAATYLEKLGYTAEKQGGLEKYLVVFRKARPLGFILADGSVRLVNGEKGADGIRQILGFLEKNHSLELVGNGEFLIGDIRGNQYTTYFDSADQIVRYAVYIHDKNGEVRSTIFDSEKDAAYEFISKSQVIDLKKYLPQQEGFMNRARSRLIRYLMQQNNKNKQQVERL